MSKLLRISMTLLLAGSLIGCGANDEDDVADNNSATETTNTTDTTTDKTADTDVNDTGDHKLEVADDVAEKITELEEVESANVIVTDNNAYVGVVLKEAVDGNEELENKIADEARTTNRDFNNVYVSTNPDFAKQFTEYGEKIRANKPVEGLFEEFTDSVQRVFPDAK